MAINITNLINAINAKSSTVGAGVDSALDKAVSLAGDVKNALVYSTIDDLPAANSSNSGEIVRLGRSTNASTQYYISFRDKWKQIGVSDSDVITANQFTPFQGTSFGYVTETNAISKFSLTSDGNSTDVGNLSAGAPEGIANQRSSTNGYATYNNNVDKFPFATDGTATDIGDLTSTRAFSAGQSALDYGYGYVAGGYYPSLVTKNVIDKFPFAADANATDVGDLVYNVWDPVGYSSRTHGYSAGGKAPPSTLNNYIQKFPFASDANATDVGDLNIANYTQRGAGQNSETDFYYSGGYTTASQVQIWRHPFASESSKVGAGGLTVARWFSAGQSSTVSGYTSGGRTPSYTNVIDKFPFASSGNAVDVGDLGRSDAQSGGTQV